MAQERAASLRAPPARPLIERVVIGSFSMVVGIEPVGAPLPAVAHHVVQAEIIGRKGIDRGQAIVAIGAVIATRKDALPDIAALEKFILEQLTPIPGIEKIRSSFALKQVRYKTALPLPMA